MTLPLKPCLRGLAVAALATGFSLPSSVLHAQFQGYYTDPDISNGRICFISEGDLWIVPEAGGVATRLTSHPGDESSPRFSPDGTQIAYTASYEGNRDLFITGINGGEPRRLTFHGYREEATAWTPDGKAVLFHTARETGFTSRRMWSVPAAGGPATIVPTGVACFLDMAADGDTVAFNRNNVQPRTWKRYGGGTADDIFVGSLKKQDFKKVTSFFGNDLSPKFIGERIYFASERDGRMNLWSFKQDGGDIKQHTKYTDFDVRFLEGDGKSKLIYQHGADLVVFDAASGKETTVAITLQSDRRGTRSRFVAPNRFIESANISDDGRKTVVTARGDLFNVPFKSGRAIELTRTSGSRERDAQFAGKDDELVVFVSDKNGDEEIFKRNARTGEGEEAITKPGDGRLGRYHYSLTVAPDGEKIAWSDNVGALYTSSVTTKTLTLVDQSKIWELRDFDWSPDSRYIAYSKYDTNEYSRIYVYDTEDKKSHAVTDPFFESMSPSFDPDMKYLFFLSNRSFNGWGDRVDYEMIMAPMTRPYALILQKDGKNPFTPTDPYEEDDEKKAKEEKKKKEAEERKKKAEEKKEADAKDEKKPGDGKDGGKPAKGSMTPASREDGEDGDADGGEEDAGDGEAAVAMNGRGPGKGAAKDKKKDDLKIDFDGLADRIFVFEGEPQDLRNLVATKGRILYTSFPLRGRNEDTWGTGEPDRAVVKSFAFTGDKKEEKTWGTVDSFSLSRNREHVLYLKDSRILTTSPAAGPGKEDKAAQLDEASLLVDVRQEWAQIFEEAYRLNRDFFYMRDMAGTKWREVADRYKALLPRLSTREELNDVLGNLIGELGHGHTYVWGAGDAGDGGGARPVGTGHLGATFTIDKTNNRFQFDQILLGDRWEMGTLAPFNRPNISVKKGDYLIAIDGENVTADRDVYSYLWGRAGKETTVTVNDKPSAEGARTYRIVPIQDEGDLWYRAEVEANRAYVDKMSNGEIGYLHIPDMGGPGLVAFFRDWYPQLRKKALVVDVRYNGGGNISQLLINRLRRVALAWGKNANFESFDSYPSRVFIGPMACLINQNAGSDGDIFPYNFRKAKLGPLIGTTTWGGVVGIRSDKPFMDRGMITIPEFGHWDEIVGYDIENYGVKPDKGFEVDIMPQDYVAGRDPQLDKAIEYLKGEMNKPQYQKPSFPKNPVRDTDYFRKRSEDYMKKP